MHKNNVKNSFENKDSNRKQKTSYERIYPLDYNKS